MKYSRLKGYKYKLEEDVVIPFDSVYLVVDHPFVTILKCELTIKKGYNWDGASYITFDTKSSMKGSLVHDALYQVMREGLLDRDKYRKYADELLRDICIEQGMWKWRANLWYKAVRKGAYKSSLPRKNPRNKVIEI